MELTTTLAFAAMPVLLLGASAALAHAYNRLHTRMQRTARDRDSYLEVLEGSNDALFVVNFVNGRIYQANEQAARLLGFDRDALVGRTIFQLHPPDLLHRSAERIADAWEQQGAIYDDIPLVSATGEVIPVESSVRVTSYRGQPAVIVFARDIRDRLALEGRVRVQQALVERQNQELLDSIRYAQRIQRAVLPEAAGLADLFPESFILFRPKDIVSGDLYWFAQRGERTIVAAADCTGHGVPGALLSLIAASLFREHVVERGTVAPAALLAALREGIITALNIQEEVDATRDGMNASVVSIDHLNGTVSYAGAYAPLYHLRDGEIIEYKGDRMPVGFQEGGLRPFSETTFEVQPGDRIYLLSDGLQDQFGGPDGKKLKSSGLKQWITATAGLSMDDQHQAISDRFRAWKGSEEQVDDVLLVGIEL